MVKADSEARRPAGRAAAAAEGAALAHALERIGDRWSLLLVAALLDGPQRFGDLQGGLEGIASNVLASRLRTLTRLGLVVATPYSTRPPRFDYRLTGAGHDLGGALRLLAAWGASGQGEGATLVHEACSTPLEFRYFCPTCDELVGDVDETWL